MTHTHGLALTLALFMGASCAKDAPSAETPATTAQPQAIETAPPVDDAAAAEAEAQAQAEAEAQAQAEAAAEAERAEKERENAEVIAKFEAAHQEELARWTPKLKARAAKLAKTRFKKARPALAKILASPHRQPAHRARDRYRHPAKTLAFFGIQPGMTVVELGAGGGWYTEILAPLLAANGTLRAVSYDPNGDATSRRTAYGKRFEMFLSRSPELYGSIEPVYVSPPEDLPLGEPGSADMALAIREMHGWQNGGNLDAYLAAVHEVLKDGGTFGVVQHRAPEGADVAEYAEKGYLPQAWVVEQVEAAGFELVESAEINANPKDTKDYADGVWTLPPGYRLGDVDREKYEAIGESDRMTLRFKKVTKS